MKPVAVAFLLLAGCLAAPAPQAAPFSLTLVEADVEVAQTFAAGADRCLPRCGGAVLTPGALLVPANATRVVVLAEWEGDAESLRLVYDHGASRVAERAVLTRGEPFVIDLAPGMPDAPGQRHSHWWFGFFALAEPAGVVEPFVARVAIHAEGVAREVAPLPNAAGRLVDARIENVGVRSPAAGFCPTCTTWTSAHPGGIVAPGSEVVRVVVAWEGPDAIAAGAWVPPETFVELELVEETVSASGGERVYEVAVDPSLADEANQTKSLWWFFGQSQLPGGAVPSFTLRAEAR